MEQQQRFRGIKRCFYYFICYYTLLLNRWDGHVHTSVKNIYASSLSCVRINGTLTYVFDCHIVIKQCCVLSPTLFAICALDIANEIKYLHLGIVFGDRPLFLFMYADKIAQTAENKNDLQCTLGVVHKWFKRMLVIFNAWKSQWTHIRWSCTKRIQFKFKTATPSWRW